MQRTYLLIFIISLIIKFLSKLFQNYVSAVDKIFISDFSDSQYIFACVYII